MTPLSPLEAARAEARAAAARAAELTAELDADKQRRAERAVEAAVQRGAIPPRSTLRAKWLKACLEYPPALELLAATNGSTALANRRVEAQPQNDRINPAAEHHEHAPVDAGQPAYSFDS